MIIHCFRRDCPCESFFQKHLEKRSLVSTLSSCDSTRFTNPPPSVLQTLYSKPCHNALWRNCRLEIRCSPILHSETLLENRKAFTVRCRSFFLSVRRNACPSMCPQSVSRSVCLSICSRPDSSRDGTNFSKASIRSEAAREQMSLVGLEQVTCV